MSRTYFHASKSVRAIEVRLYYQSARLYRLIWVLPILTCRKGPSHAAPINIFKMVYFDGWMTCDFTSFSTVFSHIRTMEKAVCNGTPFTVEKISPQAGP